MYCPYWHGVVAVGGVAALGVMLGTGCANRNEAGESPARTTSEGKQFTDVRKEEASLGGSLRNFEGRVPHTLRRHPLVQYDLPLKDELFYVHVPENYDNEQPFGILAFVAPSDAVALPAGLESVLKERRLIYMAPQKAGNSFPVSRRAGLTLAGIIKLQEIYRVDPNRIYVAGVSGGGRVAVRLAFFHPELISGALPIGGADFYEAVPKVHATQADEYGTVPVDPMLALMTRVKVPFALITGDQDPRRGNLLDLYEGGFQKRHFRAKLMDLPGVGHAPCDATTLGQALDFVETPSIWNGKGSSEAVRIVRALAQAKDPGELEAAAMEAWKADVDADLQSYAIAYARSLTNASRSAQTFELMLNALADPVAEGKRCCQLQQGNGLMRRRAQERLDLLLANPRIKDQVRAACEAPK
jgi:pimeloyl-ACP methyl ester carboxylesterase